MLSTHFFFGGAVRFISQMKQAFPRYHNVIRSVELKLAKLPASTHHVEVPLAPVTELSSTPCHCSQTRCLKMYCDCFANGKYCSSLCKCTSCENTESHATSVHVTRMSIVKRNPRAFVGSGRTVSPVCKCRHSRCRKRYCECFSAGIPCTPACGCEGCGNGKNGAFEAEHPLIREMLLDALIDEDWCLSLLCESNDDEMSLFSDISDFDMHTN